MKANHSHSLMPFDCRKRRYRTEAAARLAIRKMKARPDCRRPGTLNAYWCDACLAWHVGHARYAEGRA